MTAQSMENIIIDGNSHWMAAEPLRPYLTNLTNQAHAALSEANEETQSDYIYTEPPVHFMKRYTSCMRGYQGTWEIREEKLWLLDLKGQMYVKEPGQSGRSRQPVQGNNVESLFSKKPPIFADWYSGNIRIPIGEQLLYVHMGYGSVYEKDLFIQIENGVIAREEEADNREVYGSLSEAEKFILAINRQQQS